MDDILRFGGDGSGGEVPPLLTTFTSGFVGNAKYSMKRKKKEEEERKNAAEV
jgi:hypothetical protein